MRISAGTMETILGTGGGSALATAGGLTVPAGAKSCDITVEGQSVRYTDDGVTTPTSSVGMLLNAGTTLENYSGPMNQLSVIRVADGAKITISYYKSAGPYQFC